MTMERQAHASWVYTDDGARLIVRREPVNPPGYYEVVQCGRQPSFDVGFVKKIGDRRWKLGLTGVHSDAAATLAATKVYRSRTYAVVALWDLYKEVRGLPLREGQAALVEFKDVGRGKRTWRARMTLTGDSLIREVQKARALASRGIDVSFDLDMGVGMVFAGIRSVGTIRVVPEVQ